jgi:plastocyanin
MKKLIGSKIRQLISAGFLLAILSITSSCSKSSTVPGPNEVWIQNMSFNPITISVPIGTTITWTNKDLIDHTVTSDNGLFDSGSLHNNGVYSHMFTTAGTFPYHCAIHPFMTASVVVK